MLATQSDGHARSYHARPTTGPVVVDGQASERAWRRAVPAGDFVERYPAFGRKASQSTTFRVTFDERALFVLIDAEDDDPPKIVAQLTQRDLDSPSDWVELLLDPQGSFQTGYRFAVSARGVQLDARLSRGGTTEDRSYDASWTSAVVCHDGGYRVEMRIPFSELRYSGDVESWGIQVVRRVARTAETSVYNSTPKSASRPLLHLARLFGLSSLRERSSVNFRPYSMIKWQSQQSDRSWAARYGGDVRLNWGSSTTIHTTVLPDFGQVQQDPSQLNLTAYQVYQQERRPFFLDGLEHLQTPLSPRGGDETIYYSRRVGAVPEARDRGDFDVYPTHLPIWAATKVLHRGAGGTNLNYLAGVTGPGSGFVTDTGEKVLIAPVTSFQVARVKQEVQNGRGSVGASVTFLHRHVSGALRDELIENAITGGPDFDLRFGDYGLMGQLVGSHLTGMPQAVDRVQRSTANLLQRPDAHHLGYNPKAWSLSGYSLSLGGGKFDGTPWRAFWGGQVRSPGFNTNDLGFLQSADQQKWEVSVGYRFDQETSLTRSGVVDVGGWIEKTNSVQVTGAEVSVGTNWDFANASFGWSGFSLQPEVNDVRLLRGGPGFLVPPSLGGWWGYQTDARKAWFMSWSGNFELGKYRSNSRVFLAWTTTFRPVSTLSFSIAPTVETGANDLQYVDTLSRLGNDVAMLGRLSRQTYTLTVRMDWALALGLSLRVYAMPFLSAGRYLAFYEVIDGLAGEYSERRRRTDYAGAAQFVNTQLRSSVVGRWEFLPLSSLYLVWTHDQGVYSEDHRRVHVGREFGALGDSPAVDVVMLKGEVYWTR